jgi:hypothetical protein
MLLAMHKRSFIRMLVIPPDPHREEKERTARLMVCELENEALPIDVLRTIYVMATNTPVIDVETLVEALTRVSPVDTESRAESQQIDDSRSETATARKQFMLLRELFSVYDHHFTTLGVRRYLASVSDCFTRVCVAGDLRMAKLLYESCASVRIMTYIEKRRLLGTMCERRDASPEVTVRTLEWICNTCGIDDSHVINLDGTRLMYDMTIGEGYGALIKAAVAGDIQICRFLVQRFPNIDWAAEALRSTGGMCDQSPLFCAACWACTDVIAWMCELVEARATKLGRTMSYEERHAFASASAKVKLTRQKRIS